MRFTEQELAMLAVLRRQRDTWPTLRMFMSVLSILLLVAGAWELYSSGLGGVSLILLLTGVTGASHTYRNWHGPPEASLLLKLIEQRE
jgi:hypothetical protein